MSVVELRRVLEEWYPGEDARYYHPMSVGSAPEHSDRSAALILDGTKTLTFSLRSDYPDGNLPFVGALSVRLDGARQPRGVVEIRRVATLSFGAITDDMTEASGGERTVEWWRREIGSFCGERLARSEATLTALFGSGLRSFAVCDPSSSP